LNSDGLLLRQIQLPRDVVSPWHTIQLSSGQFVVCHGDYDDPVHRVCLIGSDVRVVESFGGLVGSGKQRADVPAHLAVDQNQFVYVADASNLPVLNIRSAVMLTMLPYSFSRGNKSMA